MANKDLHNAKKAKNDEFYTQLSDIEKELNHYRHCFKGKTILCNCDDPRVSKFFYFFFSRFHTFGLKRLIVTCYKNLNPDLFSQNLDEQAVYCIYDGKDRADDVIRDMDTFVKQNEWGALKGDGDFRSAECIELLKQADIVCTNPPFSLFREYVTQLAEYEKKFIIVGNKNAITYKEIFKLIKENKMWVGYMPMGVDMLFDVPADFAKEFIACKKEGSSYRIVDGVVKGRSQSVWFTNLNHKRRNEFLILYKNYNKKEYPKYDNYDAIEVGKVTEIPQDYDGVMGVPITFLDKYNPDQFEIIGLLADKREKSDALIQGTPTYLDEQHKKYVGAILNGKATYARILIKRKL
ncbi:putative adenine-specific methylase [Spirochaetia bacterium]|nr:putative adenine-specific methylase [Spirochaetia bacterium]